MWLWDNPVISITKPITKWSQTDQKKNDHKTDHNLSQKITKQSQTSTNDHIYIPGIFQILN